MSQRLNQNPIRIAVLAPSIAAQLGSQVRDENDLDVVWSGSDLESLLEGVARSRPAVIVADIERLGTDPTAAVESILALSGADLIVVAYTFARRDELRRLESAKVRTVRAPTSVDSLKLAMMSVLVRGILAPAERTIAKASAPTGARQGLKAAAPASAPVPPPRFDGAQLGKLQEIASAIQCECPNHVASTLITLRGFEEYSQTCINRDPKDAEVHRMLYERTAAARVIMEEALVDLLKHESIVI